jgi:hypothetical protein
MNKLYLIALLLLFTISYVTAEPTQINEEYTIWAIVVDSSNVPLDFEQVNISIYAPNTSLVLTTNMTEQTDSDGTRYHYTFIPDRVGNWYAQATFYNDSELITTNGETITVEEQSSMIQNIWDWLVNSLFPTKNYDTVIIGKKSAYNTVLFRTEATFILTNCTLIVNSQEYNMTITNTFAEYEYYIPDGGVYDWNVTCT